MPQMSYPILFLRKLNLNETDCDQAKFSLFNMYKTFWRNKLENQAVLKKGKLRNFIVSSHYFIRGFI